VKRVLAIGLIVGVIGSVVFAAVVTVWGGVWALATRRALQGPAAAQAETPHGGERRVPQGMAVVEGTIVVGSDAESDIVVQTASGERVTVGLGPGWLATQDLALRVGDKVSVRGYAEDGEFKAAQITRLSDGKTVTLRDATGRPAWSGQGKRLGQSGGRGTGR